MPISDSSKERDGIVLEMVLLLLALGLRQPVRPVSLWSQGLPMKLESKCKLSSLYMRAVRDSKRLLNLLYKV
jgi:hypothetical protein